MVIFYRVGNMNHFDIDVLLKNTRDFFIAFYAYIREA